MKAALVLLASVFALAGTPGMAETSSCSRLLGSWGVDVTRLPVPFEARPKSVTLTFSQGADGKYQTDVIILGSDGSKRRMTGTYAADGTPYSIEGDTMEADIAAVTLPTPDVMVLALGKGGIPASTRIYALLPGGNEMVETATYVGDDGKPLIRTNHFTRIPSSSAPVK